MRVKRTAQGRTRLADEVTLVTAEGNRVVSVVDALVLCCLDHARLPRLASIKRLQKSLPCAQQETCIVRKPVLSASSESTASATSVP